METTLDLTAVLYEQRSKERLADWDPSTAHMSDLHGCDRAAWYRRHGEPGIPHSAAKLALFDQGHGYEHQVRLRLQQAGFDVRAEEVHAYGLVGHTDMTDYGRETMIDAKFMVAGKTKEFASPHYVLATAAYAMAKGWRKVQIIVGNAKPGRGVEEVVYSLDIYDLAYDVDGKPFGPLSTWHGLSWADIVELRAQEVVERTGPDAEIPDADPGDFSPWGCAYCPMTQCVKNPLHGKEVAW